MPSEAVGSDESDSLGDREMVHPADLVVFVQ